MQLEEKGLEVKNKLGSDFDFLLELEDLVYANQMLDYVVKGEFKFKRVEDGLSLLIDALDKGFYKFSFSISNIASIELKSSLEKIILSEKALFVSSLDKLFGFSPNSEEGIFNCLMGMSSESEQAVSYYITLFEGYGQDLITEGYVESEVSEVTRTSLTLIRNLEMVLYGAGLQPLLKGVEADNKVLANRDKFLSAYQRAYASLLNYVYDLDTSDLDNTVYPVLEIILLTAIGFDEEGEQQSNGD